MPLHRLRTFAVPRKPAKTFAPVDPPASAAELCAGPWYTLAEVAEKLRVSFRTVERLTAPGGGLAFLRAGGRRKLVPRAALERWVRKNLVNAEGLA